MSFAKTMPYIYIFFQIYIYETNVSKIKRKASNVNSYTIGVKLQFPLMLENVYVL